jgi:hypothetical protein
MTASSWLFVRGDESIRVVRPEGRGLVVLGPGALREVRDFGTEADLQEYQVALAERLSELGWVLLGPDVDRRKGTDRRRAPRTTADRRAPVDERLRRDLSAL